MLPPEHRYRPLFEATIVSVLFTCFGYFSQSNLYLVFGSLVVSSFIISAWIAKDQDWLVAWGLKGWNKFLLFYTLGAVGFVSIFAFLYRNMLGYHWYPESIQFFALVSIAIGITEELVFRGALFGQMRQYGIAWVMLFTALAHTIYKVSIFWNSATVDALFLFCCTAVVGLLLGTLRILSNSIWPCIAFHAFFDFIVYGDLLKAPWWVW